MKKTPRNIWMINHFAIPPDMPGGSRHYDFGIELVKRVKQVLQRSRKTIEVNFIGTSNLLNAVENNSIERVVFLSTSEVFGSNAYKVGDNANSTFGPTDEARWSYAICDDTAF
jgi:GDP-D-mannose dehydratase